MPACRRKSWKKNRFPRSHNPYLEKYTDTGNEMTEEITPSILSSIYLYTCLNDPPLSHLSPTTTISGRQVSVIIHFTDQ